MSRMNLMEATKLALQGRLTENKYYIIMSTNRGMWGGMQTPMKFNDKIMVFKNKDDATNSIPEQGSVNNFNSYGIEEVDIDEEDLEDFFVVNSLQDIENAKVNNSNKAQINEETAKKLMADAKNDIAEAFKDEPRVKIEDSVTGTLDKSNAYSSIIIRLYRDLEHYEYTHYKVTVYVRESGIEYELEDYYYSQFDNKEDLVKAAVKLVNKTLNKIDKI